MSEDIRDGGTTIARAEGHRLIDCTVLKIIAMHAGPVAVGPSGAVTESGDVQSTGAASAAGAASGGGVISGIFTFFKRLIELAICLAAAAVVMMKARPSVVADVSAGHANVGAAMNSVAPALTADNLGYAGLAFAVLGVLWLLAGLIYKDLLPAGALTVAGIYGAGDFLPAHGMMSEAALAKLRPLGVPIAAAVGILGLLHFFVGGWPLF